MTANDSENRNPGGKFSRKQEEAIAALLAHRTIAKAAEAAGVSEATLLRWMKGAEFRKELAEARDVVFRDSLDRLKQASVLAVEKLTSLMFCGQSAVELSAARTILEQAHRTSEALELRERLEEVERLLGPKKGGVRVA